MVQYLIFTNNEKCVFNRDLLINHYKNGKLKGAEIFALLFKLKKNNFNNDEMIIDKNNNITLCKYLEISFSNWNIFMNFLKNREMPINTSYTISILDLISNKFGGIPSIDNYKENIYYNPQNPKDDYKQKYTWKVDYVFNSKNYKDYEMTVDNNLIEKNMVYYKKKN